MRNKLKAKVTQKFKLFFYRITKTEKSVARKKQKIMKLIKKGNVRTNTTKIQKDH